MKVAAEYREKVRHVRMDESRKERLQRLHDEANESQTMYNQITENWMNSAEKLLPLEFYTKVSHTLVMTSYATKLIFNRSSDTRTAKSLRRAIGEAR